MKMLLSLLVLSVVFLTACDWSTDREILTNTRPLPYDPSWAMSPTWDDGKAEVATYDAWRTVYEKRRTFQQSMITVKEVFNRKYNVKTDGYQRDDLFTVMKVNLAARIETDAYPYHYLTSVFFLRDAPYQVHKFTSSSQEWCGNTFKHVQRTDSNLRYTFDSYWDGEGIGERTLPVNAVLEDQLCYSLRALPFTDRMPPFQADVIPTMITNKALSVAPQHAIFRVSSDILDPSMFGTTSEIPEQECWRVEMQRADGVKAHWWFSKDQQRTMLRFRHDDGRLLQLRSVERRTYWLDE